MHTAIEPVGKACSCCQQQRPITAFPHSPLTVDGRTDKCLRCISAAAHEARLQRDLRRPSPKAKSKRKAVSHSHTAHRRDGQQHGEQHL